MKYQNVDSKQRRGSYAGMTATVLGSGKDAINVIKSKVGKRGKDAAMTVGQRTEQARFATLMAAYDALKPLLTYSFEQTRPQQARNGLFLKHNVYNVPVLLTQPQAEIGTQVLGNYVVSFCGAKLPPIKVDTVGLNHVFGINVGDLNITDDTTILEFSSAIVANNNGIFHYGDALTIAVCTQQLPVNGYPAKIDLRIAKVDLYGYNDDHGQQKLSTVAPLKYFHVTELTYDNGSKARFLSYPSVNYTLVAPIHSRRLESGQIVCSDQQLHGKNPYIDILRLSQPKGNELLLTYGRLKPSNRFNPLLGSDDLEPEALTLAQYMAEQLGTNTEQTPESGATEVVISTAVQPSGAGTVSGGGTYSKGAQVTLTATPTNASEKPFSKWSDGNTQNPRTITANSNQTFTAIFGTQSGGGDSEQGGGGID